MERPLGSSTPEVRDHTDSSGRSSPSSQSESSGYSTSSTTPFDSFIFDETDSISCHVANGYLLLITNMWDLQHPEPRIGTKEDSEQVERFFRRAGFTVKKLYNQSKDQMEKEFKSLVQTTQLCKQTKIFYTIFRGIYRFWGKFPLTSISSNCFPVAHWLDSCLADIRKILFSIIS